MAAFNCQELLSNILTYALVHDEDEAITGDIPSPVNLPNVVNNTMGTELLKEMSHEDMVKVTSIVKLADTMEAMLFLHEEMAIGNQRVKGVLSYIRSKYIEAHGKAREYMTDKWKNEGPDVFMRTYLIGASSIMKLPIESWMEE